MNVVWIGSTIKKLSVTWRKSAIHITHKIMSKKEGKKLRVPEKIFIFVKFDIEKVMNVGELSKGRR